MRGRRPAGPGGIAPAAAVVAGLLTLLAAPAAAQSTAGGYGPHMATRTQLSAMVDSLQGALGIADEERSREIQARIAGIRARLENGDVDPGDVVYLRVSGEDLAKWTDSFTVTQGRELELPDIAPIPLAGALYSEVEGRIAEAIGRYVREPRLSVEVLKRIAVVGQVASPGFYHVKSSALVSDVIMTAGGPGEKAKLEKIRVRRGGDRLDLDETRIAYQSITLDQLGIRSGDELYVPGGAGSPPWKVLAGILGTVASITVIITRL